MRGDGAGGRWLPSPSVGRGPVLREVAAAVDELALGALRIVLVGGLATELVVAAGVLADAGGAHPWRRLTVVGVLVGTSTLAVLKHVRLGALLRRHPRLVLGAALVYSALFAWDQGGFASPFATTGFPLLCIAAVVGSARLVFETAAVLGAGYVFALVAGGAAPAELASRPQVDAVVDSLSLYAGVAVALAVIVGTFRASMRATQADLVAVRSGASATTPELGAAIRRLRTLPRADATALLARLTSAERRVVEQLADGLLAKQIAVQNRVRLSTIRSQIKAAKRKTGARTLTDLAAIARAGAPPGLRGGDRAD